MRSSDGGLLEATVARALAGRLLERFDRRPRPVKLARSGFVCETRGGASMLMQVAFEGLGNLTVAQS